MALAAADAADMAVAVLGDTPADGDGDGSPGDAPALEENEEEEYTRRGCLAEGGASLRGEDGASSTR